MHKSDERPKCGRKALIDNYHDPSLITTIIWYERKINIVLGYHQYYFLSLGSFVRKEERVFTRMDTIGGEISF